MSKGHPFYVSKTDAPAKQAIMEVALRLFSDRGVDGVTIRDIAERSNFTNPAMFRHFKSKDELAFALFEACYRKLSALLNERRLKDAPLNETINVCLEFIEESPESVHFVLDNLRRYYRELPAELRTRSIVGSFRRLIAAEQRRGRIRASVDVDVAVALVVGALSQIARMAHFRELSRPPTALADELGRLISNGIGA